MKRILIVDDEPRMAQGVVTALGRLEHECETCGGGAAALEAFARRPADLVITDWKMPGMDGLELLRQLRQRAEGVPVILLTAHADVDSAVAAMREGAFDYLAKPFQNDELRARVVRALEVTDLKIENRDLRQSLTRLAGQLGKDGLVAVSEKSKAVVALAQRVAQSQATVLLQGESGTGKELIARLLHYSGPRATGPFVAINCKALAEGVLESELFGHERGAFTGASAARAGCFERADRGTLFLDEIGEVTGDFQAKLLRVLQEREVLRVGGTEPRKVDVRIVAAVQRSLRDAVLAGRFREDLYFRINVISIQLAPLRERREDVVPLAEHFLERHFRSGGRKLALGKEAAELLLAHAWPGNVRELENAIERAVVFARGDTIAPEDLILEGPAAPATAVSGSGTLQETLDQAASLRIRAALEAAHQQRQEASRALGVDRTTLYRWMKRLGLE